MAGSIRYFTAGPLPAVAILLLIGLVLLMIPLLFLGIIGAAFTRLGLSWVAALALVLLMLAGSFVNIPLFRIRRDMIQAVPLDNAYGEPGYPFPAVPVWETRISINFGGAILPVLIAAYLISRAAAAGGTPLLVSVILCTAACMAVSFIFSRGIAGVGIHVPLLIPALSALLVGFLLSGGITGLPAAATAFAGGTLGTLAGGNLARLPGVRELDVPEVSIGGSGTFGAVFLCCILPALIA
jgi:uncharacterized membrane protein